MNYRLQETAVGGRRGVKFIIPGLMSPTNDLLVYPFRLGLVWDLRVGERMFYPEKKKKKIVVGYYSGQTPKRPWNNFTNTASVTFGRI